MPLRLVMMGTGAFALPTFQRLITSEHDVVGLVTQPDRTGRGHHQHVNPLKETALRAEIPVFQPERVNSPDSLTQLQKFAADLFVVAAYGQILSTDLISIPRLGSINLHASLLPKYRGAAPIQYAIWNGETETGVTIFQIEPRLDAGPILGMVKIEIGPKETSGELHDRLAELGAALTLEVLHQFETGTLHPLPQNPAGVTKAPRLKKEQGAIDWSRTSQKIGWHVRAMQPWPMPYTFLHLPDRPPQRILILDVDPVDDSEWDDSQPGDILSDETERILVRTGDGLLQINTLQPAGKRAMSAAEFLRGTRLTKARLGESPE